MSGSGGGAADVPANELVFRFVTNRPALALTATVGERWRGRIERLRSPADLARWYVAAGLLSAPPPVSDRDLRRCRELREAVYRSVLRRMRGAPPQPEDQQVINDTAALPPLAPRLEGGSVRWDAAAEPATAALSTVARDAVDLLSGADAARLRECASPTCALLFLDTSRPGARRWCSSAACGGAARAAAYRRRRAAAQEA